MMDTEQTGLNIADQSAESAYRRGFTHGMEEMSMLVFQLLEQGYSKTAIRRYLAVYDDHFILPWRNEGDRSRREPPPPFQIDVLDVLLASTNGYDWIR